MKVNEVASVADAIVKHQLDEHSKVGLGSQQMGRSTRALLVMIHSVHRQYCNVEIDDHVDRWLEYDTDRLDPSLQLVQLLPGASDAPLLNV